MEKKYYFQYTQFKSQNFFIDEGDIKLALESLGYINADVSKWIKDEELADINNIGDAIKTILQKIQNKK